MRENLRQPSPLPEPRYCFTQALQFRPDRPAARKLIATADRLATRRIIGCAKSKSLQPDVICFSTISKFAYEPANKALLRVRSFSR
jgi:hypothetical protein